MPRPWHKEAQPWSGVCEEFRFREETPTTRNRAAVDRSSRDRPPPVARGGSCRGRDAHGRHAPQI